ncbi:hypothetical protein ABK040_004490 [Willaertia magna]
MIKKRSQKSKQNFRGKSEDGSNVIVSNNDNNTVNNNVGIVNNNENNVNNQINISSNNKSPQIKEQEVIEQVLHDLTNPNVKLTNFSSTNNSQTTTNLSNLLSFYNNDSKENDDELSLITSPNKKPFNKNNKLNNQNEEEEEITFQPKSSRITLQKTKFSTTDRKKRRKAFIEEDDNENNDETFFYGKDEEDINNNNKNNNQLSLIMEDSESNRMIEEDDENDNSNIPDDITIRAIKMKRKKLREEGLNSSKDVVLVSSSSENYIPLEDNNFNPNEKAGLGYSMKLHQSPSQTSRLIREEDEEENNIDEIINTEEEAFESWKDSKLAFGLPKDDRNHGDTRESLGVIEIDDEEQEGMMKEDMIDKQKEREYMEFELEQLRHAGVTMPDDDIHSKKKIVLLSSKDGNLFEPKQEEEDEEMKEEKEMMKIQSLIQKFSKKEGERIIQSFEQVQNQLQSKLKDLEISFSNNQNQLLEMNEETEKCASNISQLNEDNEAYEEQYKYFQEMNNFVENLSDLLDTKVNELDLLESELLDLQEKYYGQLFERSFHGHSSSYHEINNSLSSGGVLLTEKEFYEQLNYIVEKLKHLFDDADDEYYNIQKLKHKFEGWKLKYPNYYKDTYCSLCLQKLFTPFVRWQLLCGGKEQTYKLEHFTPKEEDEEQINYVLPIWSVNPLDAPDFDHFDFWKELFNFGQLDGFTNDPNDDDHHMLPTLIRKNFISYLIHIISKIYNPFKTQQSTQLIHLIQEYKVYLEEKHLEEEKLIFGSITKRIEETIHLIKCPIDLNSSEEVEQYFNQSIDFINQSVLPWIEVFSKFTICSISERNSQTNRWMKSIGGMMNNNKELEDNNEEIYNFIMKMKYIVVRVLINSKIVYMIDNNLKNNVITMKDKIRLISKIIGSKLPKEWKLELHVSID